MVTVKDGRKLQISKALEMIAEILTLVTRPHLIERFSANLPFNKIRPSGMVAMQLDACGRRYDGDSTCKTLVGELSGLSLFEVAWMQHEDAITANRVR